MGSDKKHFLLRLIPPRKSFTADMSEEERRIMQAHVSYWAPYVKDGTMIVMGPVMDPEGGYGLGVIAVDDEDQLHRLLAADPANGLNRYEVFLMRAVTRDNR